MTVSLEYLNFFPDEHPPGIGCAGEIQIAPHEDYAQWAIDILVKFRDNEKLQLLTGQRQSGGVRCHFMR
jgi:hypothetical protein